MEYTYRAGRCGQGSDGVGLGGGNWANLAGGDALGAHKDCLRSISSEGKGVGQVDLRMGPCLFKDSRGVKEGRWAEG